MKNIHIFLLLFCALFSLSSTLQAQEQKQVVLVSQDFTEALAQCLTKDTTIEVKRAIPPNYAAETHTSYLKNHWDTFANLSQSATAVLTLTGSWPGDPIYPWSRRANIRIVPIDISMPINNSRAGVPLLNIPGSTKQLRSIWNSPGNAARMADITASDLIQLLPTEKEIISQNRDNLKQKLFKLRTQYEIAFSELKTFEALSLTPDFYYLTDEFGISILAFFLKEEHHWTDKDIQDLTQTIHATGVTCIIAKWEPKQEIQTAINNTGAKIIIPTSFSLKDDSPAVDQLLRFYESNLRILLEGLSTDSISNNR